MKKVGFTNVFKMQNKLFTINLESCKGLRVYGEKLISYKNNEFRSWNPYRSKLAAAILNGLSIKINSDSKVLYLGAATGTTVSHFSDIVKNGIIYSIEKSPVALKKLLELSEKRNNIIPILENAAHPEKYNTIISNVDFVYQDISQRNQAEIFITNINSYLKNKCNGILMVKARSVDVSLKPEKAYERVCSKLEENGLKVKEKINLQPYEKDHAAILIST